MTSPVRALALLAGACLVAAPALAAGGAAGSAGADGGPPAGSQEAEPGDPPSRPGTAGPPPGVAGEPAPRGSLTLEDCFRTAAGRSERIGRASEDYTQALLVKRTARANVIPRLTVEDTYYRQNTVELAPPGGTAANAFTFADSRNELLVKLRQPIFSGFRDRNFLVYSDHNIEAFRHSLEEARRLLYADIARAFYLALQRQGEVGTLEDSVEVERERLREVQARHEVGLARKTELLLVQAQLAEDESNLTRARNELLVAHEQLGFLMGAPAKLPLRDDVRLPERLDEAPPVEEAVARRSDMRQREQAVKAARTQVAVARGEYYPTLDLEANRYLDRRNFSTFAQETDWSAEITFSFPLFDGGRARANVATAHSKLQQAVLARDELARQIDLEVQSAWLTLQSDVARLKTLETSVASADENYRLIEEEYRGGLATNLEVITAHNLLLSARLDLERQKFQVGLDWIGVRLAQGQLPGDARTDIDLSAIESLPPLRGKAVESAPSGDSPPPSAAPELRLRPEIPPAPGSGEQSAGGR